VLLSNEETDLLARIAARGGRIGYAPAATVRHHIDPARLCPEWFRRRAAWQAVSEFLQDPARAAAAGPAAYEGLIDLLCALPADQRNLHGLATPTDDPARFADQVHGIHKLTTALLGGLRGADG
jgi:glucosyl-dolichyl phosphate glucuronosyltransferase